MTKQWRKILRASMPRSRQSKNNHQREKRERCRLSQARARPYAAVVYPGQRDGDDKPKQKMRKIDGIAAETVQLVRVQRREQISSDSSCGQPLERTSKEVAEEDHPAGGKADASWKEKRDISGLSGRVGDRPDQLAIDVADRQQHQGADGESQDCAQRAAALQQIVHDNQPGGTDHHAEGQRKVIDQSQLASQCDHEIYRSL